MNKKISTLASIIALSTCIGSTTLFADEPICFSEKSLEYINYMNQLYSDKVKPDEEKHIKLQAGTSYYQNKEILVSSARDYLILDFKPHIGTLSGILLQESTKTTLESEHGFKIDDYRLDENKKYALSEIDGNHIERDEIWIDRQPYLRFILSKNELISQLGDGYHELLCIEYETLGGFRGYQQETKEMTYSASTETPVDERLSVGIRIQDNKIISYHY